MQADLTLIINLSAGDATYAHLTIAALAKAHRETAKEIIIILDDTKAQTANFYDHSKRYSEPDFTEKLKTVTVIAKNLKQVGLVDEVIVLSQYSAHINLNKKYLNNRLKETHDFRGAPITAYLTGFEVCKTQFLVRYDGDMLLHQSPVDWIVHGIDLLKKHHDCVAVSPQPSPHLSQQKIEIKSDPTYWFSTRCTLFDRIKILNEVPFLQGKYYVEVLLRKWFKKTYPPAFETILFQRFKKRKLKNYYLLNHESWLLHPEEKNEIFIELLPKIIVEIKKGLYPLEQTNHETLKLDAWQKFFKQKEI